MENYTLINKNLFNELDDLIMKGNIEKLMKNKKIRDYIDICDSVESGNLPEIAYQEFDNIVSLNELITIVKNILEK